MLGSETAETNLRTLLQPCYLQLLGVAVGERDCGDESADAAVTMLFATVGRRCWKRDCGDESVDAAVTMKPVPKHLVFSFVFGSLKTCFRFFGNTCFFDFWARF